ncbi:hypothetical protein Desfe_1345 [Desulfurococcus amylolyticus DSM 16532]|uniref:Uncharacterized protein n=2 Tax=Desulfurococcus amylolyticus TaxID=94694 RepID=I3XTD7_DESAM|nr:hypothetical protein Desfe_1345 [Desulfurococcus amylolyticus DSM 16532]
MSSMSIDLNTLSNIILVILMVILIVYLYLESRPKKPPREEYVTRVLIQCSSCEYRLEKDFEAGDFIGLDKGKCPKCGGIVKIRGIYAVEKSKILKPQ